MAKFSTEKFNENYQNETITKNSRDKLWTSIGGSGINASDSAVVNLKFANNRLYVQLIEFDVIIQEIVLKAKVKGNYLSVKREFMLIPIPFFFFIVIVKLFWQILKMKI